MPPLVLFVDFYAYVPVSSYGPVGMLPAFYGTSNIWIL